MYICAWFGLVIALLMAFLKNALMCILKKKNKRKKVKLINHDCLPTLMLLYIMLCVLLAYLMLLATLSNAVCLYDAFFFFIVIDFCKSFLLSCFVLVYWHIVYLFHILICIMYSAFNLLVFPNSIFPPFSVFSNEWAICSLEK